VSTYLGYDVLDTVDFNRRGAIEERIQRLFVTLDTATGKMSSDEHSPAPAPVRPFTWTAFGRAEIAELFDFLDARKGRAVPFWLPSYQKDLSLSADVLQNDSNVTLAWVRYTQQMFPNTAGRRHLAFWEPNVPMTFHKVVDADDPSDGLTETLTITPVALRLYPASTTILSFLKLCRLEEDLVRMHWPTVQVVEATIMVRELPKEAPL